MARRKKIKIDDFSHSSSTHLRSEFLAMNRRFSNLTAYGLYFYLCEKCALGMNTEIPFSSIERETLAHEVGMDQGLFEDIVSYMINNAKLATIKNAEENPVLIIKGIESQIIKKSISRELRRQKMSEKRLQQKRTSGIPLNVRENEADKRKRILNNYNKILVLTPSIEAKAKNMFPLHGSIVVYFKKFKDYIKTRYVEFHGKITDDSYEGMFYQYMNNYKIPLTEALIADKVIDGTRLKNSTRRVMT